MRAGLAPSAAVGEGLAPAPRSRPPAAGGFPARLRVPRLGDAQPCPLPPPSFVWRPVHVGLCPNLPRVQGQSYCGGTPPPVLSCEQTRTLPRKGGLHQGDGPDLSTRPSCVPDHLWADAPFCRPTGHPERHRERGYRVSAHRSRGCVLLHSSVKFHASPHFPLGCVRFLVSAPPGPSSSSPFVLWTCEGIFTGAEIRTGHLANGCRCGGPLCGIEAGSEQAQPCPHPHHAEEQLKHRCSDWKPSPGGEPGPSPSVRPAPGLRPGVLDGVGSQKGPAGWRPWGRRPWGRRPP